ncbi:F-box/LRR-repeat protein 25-like [Rosa sericea]
MKRMRQISGPDPVGGSSPRKCNRIDNDRISALPDDILHHIISFLSLREAVSTSVLSHRWKNMYAYMSNLKFDWCKMLAAKRAARRVSNPNRGVYCRKNVRFLVIRIDRFLTRHLGSRITSFKVRCCLKNKYAFNINDWIDCAVRKGVENLDLAFTCDDISERMDWPSRGYYQFPTHLLVEGKASRLRHLSLRSCMLGLDFQDRFSTLSTLVLCDVYFDGQANPLMFCSCLKLQSLTLQSCFGLERFSISLDYLKSLVVRKCIGLRGIELSAPNLTTFYCEGNVIKISCIKVPNLVEVYVSLGGINVIHTFAQLEKDLPNVKSLTVNKRNIPL